MSPLDYYVGVFKNKYADFDGRARRSEYWYFILFNMLALMVAMAVDSVLGYPVFYFLYAIVAFVPGLAVLIRRLHDTDRSGWWILISFIPLVGVIVLIVFLATDSTPGTNQFGPNPKDPDAFEDDITAHLVD